MPGDIAAFELQEYTVGWVCALPLEMAAARGMLDKIHPNLAQQDPGDLNSYVLGEIHGHKIVIACLPVGNYGTSPAATVATHLLRTFKSIRFGLMVGIGGGAPSEQHDIRVGDVVIGQPSGVLGGVVQHDRGKVLQGGFERTGFQNAPPQLLLAALARVQATHMNQDSQVPQYLAHLVAKSPKRMKHKFRYQGSSNDRLFQADYDHAKPGNPTCEDCETTKLIDRKEREDTDPYFHYGIIASGNQVIKDGKTRQHLAKEYNALCFEMEAAGLYDFPCLVIRGICDYADSHKNKVWQEYAAAAASAFAKELLQFVAPKQVLREKKLVPELLPIAKDHLETSVQILQEQRHIRQTLENRPLDLHIVHNARYDSEDVRNSPRCEADTRVRVLKLIQSWADQDSGQSLFWLIGPAGTGKSTITRTIIDTLERDKRLAAGYLFKRGEQNRNDTNRLFSTVAAQMSDTVVSFKEGLRKSLEGLKKDAVEKISLETQFHKLIWHPLETLKPEEANNLPRVIVVDGLDECERPENLSRLLELFSKLCTASKLHLRVLITSRYAPEIVEAFEPILQKDAVRTLELHRDFSDDTNVDIRKFLKSKLADIKYKRRVQTDPWPTTEDLDRLVQLSTTPEPLFIYAATLCRFVSDNQQGPTRQLKMWLKQENTSQLHQIYNPILDQAFQGFTGEEFHQKLQFMGAITLLARPLSAQSLATLLIMEIDDISWWVSKLHAVLHIPFELYKPIELLHKSFADFLGSSNNRESHRYRIDKAEIHADIAEKCIQCMKKGLKQDICRIQTPGTMRDDIDGKVIRDHIPDHLEYACINWYYHVKLSGGAINRFSYTFLLTHLLHWIEAMTLLGRLAECPDILDKLSRAIQLCDNILPDLIHLLEDTRRVISAFGTTIELFPLQFYGSLLFFSPTTSKLRQMFWHQRIPRASQIQGVEANWGASLQVIQHESTWVALLAFSPDGNLLASIFDCPLRKGWVTQIRHIVSGTNIYTSENGLHLPRAMAFSSDSRLLLSAHDQGRLKILDVTTGQVQRIWTGDMDSIWAVGFEKDSNHITSVSRHGILHYWENVQGSYKEKFKSPCILPTTSDAELKLLRAAFSPCMQVLAFQTLPSQIKCWNLEIDAQVLTLDMQGAVFSTSALEFSVDGQLIASACDEVLRVWDVKAGTLKHSIEHEVCVDSIAFSPTARVIASGSQRLILLWDLDTGLCITTLLDEVSCGITALALSVDGSTLASPRQIWDITQPQEHQVDDGYIHNISSIAWSPNDQLVASGSDNNTIQIWDATTLTPKWVLVGHRTEVVELLFSIDSDFLISSDIRGTKKVWNMSSGTETTPDSECSSASEVEYSADGQIVAAVFPHLSVVRLFEAETGIHLQELEIPKENDSKNLGVSAIFSDDGRSLVTYTPKDPPLLWDISTGKHVHCLPEHGILSTILEVKFSPDNQIIAIVDIFHVAVWCICTSTPFTIPCAGARAAFSSDSKVLALASSRQDVTMWDLEKGSCILTIEGHKGIAQAISLSPDSQIVAVSADESTRIWNLTSQHKSHLMLNHNEKISIMAFSPDGTVLVTVSPYNTIWLWDTSSGTQLNKIFLLEGLIRGVSFHSDEISVSISACRSSALFNIWNNMALRTYTYRITSATAKSSPEQESCEIQLTYDENWIRQGSRNLIWIPTQYRPGHPFFSRHWVGRNSTIYIGSDSGRLIRFQIASRM